MGSRRLMRWIFLGTAARHRISFFLSFCEKTQFGAVRCTRAITRDKFVSSSTHGAGHVKIVCRRVGYCSWVGVSVTVRSST
jgi:hypothetical protein